MRFGVGTGRRGRRLTLAPMNIRSSEERGDSEDGEEEDEGGVELRRKEGREALSRMVALVVDARQAPKPVHGVPTLSECLPLKSKFWSSGYDSEESNDDVTLSPSTPEFVKDALDAGFTLDQLVRAERALASGNSPSSSEKILPKLITSTMAKKKMVGAPWKGPLPSPRVSPPRTLGDCLTVASRRSRARSPAWQTPSGSGNYSNSFKSTIKSANSKKFEAPTPQGSDPIFPPLSSGKLPTKEVACSPKVAAGEVDRGGQASHQGNTACVKLDPGKVFRPTKGLCARPRPRRTPKQPPPRPSPLHHRSFADAVREGKPMAAQGAGNGGGFGERGGGRGGAGFNLGFNPGFDPGFVGRGRGYGFHPYSRGRGNGGYGGGRGAYGGFGGYGGHNDYGYHGRQGTGRDRRPYGGDFRGGGFGGGRGQGRGNHGRQHLHPEIAPPIPNPMAGGNLPRASHLHFNADPVRGGAPQPMAGHPQQQHLNATGGQHQQPVAGHGQPQPAMAGQLEQQQAAVGQQQQQGAQEGQLLKQVNGGVPGNQPHPPHQQEGNMATSEVSKNTAPPNLGKKYHEY